MEEDATTNAGLGPFQRLDASIRPGGLATMRTLLSQHTFPDCDIELALRISAARTPGHVESCRLLWPRLSQAAKQKYTTVEGSSNMKPFFENPLVQAAHQGHLEVVRFFILDCNFSVNQEISGPVGGHHRKRCYSPALGAAISTATNTRVEIARLLLENGADPHTGVAYSHIFAATEFGDIDMVRLLLEHGADPKIDSIFDRVYEYDERRNTDLAIDGCRADILQLLLERGAEVGPARAGAFRGPFSNSLLKTLMNNDEDDALAVCRVLVRFARSADDDGTGRMCKRFLQSTLESAIRADSCERACEILLDSGFEPHARALHVVVEEKKVPLCRLLMQRAGLDPFVPLNEGEEDHGRFASYSPFCAAACQAETAVLEVFLDHWDERFASNGGKNADGDYPVHVLCRERDVSLEAIKLVIERYAPTLSTVDGEEGLLPFHFAAMCNCKLDVLFSLARHCPDDLDPYHRRHADPTAGAASANQRSLPSESSACARASSHTGDSGQTDVASGDASSAEDVGPATKKPRTK